MKIKKGHITLLLLLTTLLMGIVCAAPTHGVVLGKTKLYGKTIKITDKDCQKIGEGKSIERTIGYKKYKVTIKKHGKKIKKTKKAKLKITIDKYYEDGTRAPWGYLYVSSWTWYHGPLKSKLVRIKYADLYGF